MIANKTLFDVLILGGGPAGLSAALWCAELGLDAVLLENNEHLGGQLNWIHTPIRNYPGIETNSGADFLSRLLDQVGKRRVEIRTGVTVSSIDVDTKNVFVSGGDTLQFRALILATGIRRRTLGVEGEVEFTGRGILETGQTDRESLKGKRVLIVGGGDAAFENADALSTYAESVYLLHRRSSFTARETFVERVTNNPRIEVITNAVVNKFAGRDRLEQVEYLDESGGVRVLAVDSVLIRIGVVPNTELFRGELDLDPRGYIQVDSKCETSATGIFAVGDAANPIAPTIASAVGMAATAVKTLRSRSQ